MAVRKKKKSKQKVNVHSLPVIHPHAAGIDLGSREHWVCCPPGPNVETNVRVFATTTPHLLEIAEWLIEQNVESVAMESTGVYWIPLYELLESQGIQVILVNARQLSHVPGRKTDMQDCQWLQLLHSCGLLKGSFRPDEAICRLRALRRQSANLTAEQSKTVQWMQKSLDQMNIQVHRAVTDITGKTGLSIIREIVSGERDPQKLALLRDPRCKKSLDEIAAHLTGTWREEHLFNLKMALRLFDQLGDMIASYDHMILHELKKLQPPERSEEPVPAHPKSKKPPPEEVVLI